MKYLETHSTDPAYNLAFEEWVLTHLTEGEYLILWQNDNTVVIGQNQNTPEEINADFVQKHGIRVVRRTTGGGAVYHDLGNLNYSFITDHDASAGTDMSGFTGLVVDALKRLELDACASGRNDILVDGKKVSGTAQRIVKIHKDGSTAERILYHGTLLFRSDPEIIAGALNADPLKFSSKSTKSVRSRVGNLSDYLPSDMSLQDFWELLRVRLEKQDCIPEKGSGENRKTDGTDTADQINEEEILQLKKEKYDSWEWNYGKSPAAGFSNRKRFAGGTLDVRLKIEKGRIEDAALYGDFLSFRAASEIADKMKGSPYTEEALRKILEGFELKEYLGGITGEEALETILGRTLS